MALGVVAVLVLLVPAVAHAHTSQVEVDPQISTDGTVVLEGVFSVVDGWAVLHRVNASGDPGEALVHEPVDGDAGFRPDVQVTLPKAAWRSWGPQRELAAALHGDDGDGRFEPSEDEIVESFGHPVVKRFTLANGSAPASVRALGFGPQTLAGDHVRVRAAVLPVSGHLAISTNATPRPSARLGAIPLEAGEHRNVTVPIDADALERGQAIGLYARLYEDDGDGAIDAGDREVRAGEEIVQTRFLIERPDRPSSANATNDTTEGGAGGAGRSTGAIEATVAVTVPAVVALLARRGA